MRIIDLAGGTEILPEAGCWARVAAGKVGRLAVLGDGRPDIFPVNYAVDDDTILVESNMGSKMLGAGGASVAFEVDSIDTEAQSGWSVVAHGRARLSVGTGHRQAHQPPRLRHLTNTAAGAFIRA